MLSGNLLREARLRAGLTQRQVAARAETSQSAIVRYEKGDVAPSLETLRRLVRATGLDLVVSIDEPLDPHDIGMLEYTLRMKPEDRLASIDDINALIGEAQRVGPKPAPGG